MHGITGVLAALISVATAWFWNGNEYDTYIVYSGWDKETRPFDGHIQGWN